MAAVRPGIRLASTVCTTEVVVVTAAATEADLRCGGRPMAPFEQRGGVSGTPQRGRDGGTKIGKRYVDAAGTVEVLCTKPGAGALAVGDELLVEKAAKPLPSSD